MVYIIVGSVLGISMLFSFGPYFRLLLGLMKSPKSKIMKFFDHSSHLNESSLYRLRKEVLSIIRRNHRINSFSLGWAFIIHYQNSRSFSQYQYTSSRTYRWFRCM